MKVIASLLTSLWEAIGIHCEYFNLNKAGIFESSFFWVGVNLIPPSYFKKK